MCFATAHFHFWSPDRSVAYFLQLQAEEVFKFPYVRTHLDAKVGPGQRRRPGLGGVAGLGGPRSFLSSASVYSPIPFISIFIMTTLPIHGMLHPSLRSCTLNICSLRLWLESFLDAPHMCIYVCILY